MGQLDRLLDSLCQYLLPKSGRGCEKITSMRSSWVLCLNDSTSSCVRSRAIYIFYIMYMTTGMYTVTFMICQVML